MIISDKNNIHLENRRVTILGLGRSGFAAARLAAHLGATVFTSDTGTGESITTNAHLLSKAGILCETGGHTSKIYDADLMVVSPGISQDATVILNAKKKHVPVISEIEFASWFTSTPILAVTGSNGKTTTVHLLVEMCQTDEYHGVLAGNVGVSFSEKVLEEMLSPDPKQVYVLEISSFQMEHIIHFKPYVSIFLNITEDHLDRYPSMDAYISAKINMVKNQSRKDYIVLNSDDPGLKGKFAASPAKQVPFSLGKTAGRIFTLNETKIYDEEHATLIHLDQIALPGQHNLANALAAATAANLLGVPNDRIRDVMSTFAGVEHRLEKVAEINGVTYYNDSKATNVDAVKVALKSFTRPILLILGGKDKGGKFSQLLPHTHNKVKEIIAYGQAKDKISAALGDAVRLEQVDSLKNAVEICQLRAVPGDIVLLSPGCASFDQFLNFEERGTTFKKFVHELETGP